MSTWFTKYMGIFLVFSFLIAPSTATADDKTSRLQKIEANGGFMAWHAENAQGTKVKWGVVDALLPASAETTIKLFRDYDNYKKFLKFFTTTKVLSKDDSKAIVRLKATIAGGTVKLKATATMTEESKANGDTHFKLRYRKGNVKRLDGDWVVTPIDDKSCLVKMRLLVDPDLWLVSNDQLSDYNLVNSRRTFRSIKKILDSK